MAKKKNKTYQLTCLFNPSLDEGKISEMTEKIKGKITSNEGTISEGNRYSSQAIKKHLAYPINKNQEAFYWEINFIFPSKEINKIDQELSLEKDIIRYIIANKKKQKPKPIRKEPIDLKIIDKIEPLPEKDIRIEEKPVVQDKVEKAPIEETPVKKEEKTIKEKVKIKELDKN